MRLRARPVSTQRTVIVAADGVELAVHTVNGSPFAVSLHNQRTGLDATCCMDWSQWVAFSVALGERLADMIILGLSAEGIELRWRDPG